MKDRKPIFEKGDLVKISQTLKSEISFGVIVETSGDVDAFSSLKVYVAKRQKILFVWQDEILRIWKRK
jgi:hypothetical protein